MGTFWDSITLYLCTVLIFLELFKTQEPGLPSSHMRLPLGTNQLHEDDVSDNVWPNK
jgi:hypothetical protein